MTSSEKIGVRAPLPARARVLQVAPAVPPRVNYPEWRRLPGPPRLLWVDDSYTLEVYEIELQLTEGTAKRLVSSEPSRVRRLERYPADWRSLEDEGLLTLFGDR
jgi:hypothetical protein